MPERRIAGRLRRAPAAETAAHLGDGPAATTLAQLAEFTGFRARAVGQAGLANLEIAPGDAHVVVATMGHFDEDALEAALAYPGVDVSLIASTRRAAAVREELLRRGSMSTPIAAFARRRARCTAGPRRRSRSWPSPRVVTARRKRGSKPVAVDISPVTFVTDPVCGMTVDPLTSPHKATYDGKTYWFCSAGCRAEFEKTPERYLRPIEA